MLVNTEQPKLRTIGKLCKAPACSRFTRAGSLYARTHIRLHLKNGLLWQPAQLSRACILTVIHVQGPLHAHQPHKAPTQQPKKPEMPNTEPILAKPLGESRQKQLYKSTMLNHT